MMTKLFITCFSLILLFACKDDKKKVTLENNPQEPNAISSVKSEPTVNKGEVPCDKIFVSHGKCFVPDKEKIYNLPIGNSPRKGGKDPIVTVIEFTDFQCPACQNFTNDTIPSLLKKYGDDLRIVFKHYPLSFHKMALVISQVSLEIRQQKGDTIFWKFHDIMFANPDKITEESYIFSQAKLLGADITKIKEALKTGKHRGAIKKDMDLGNSAGVKGTPWIYVNGKFSQRKPVAILVEEAIKEAKAIVDQGTPRNKVYSFLVDHGKPVYNKPIAKEIYQVELNKFKVTFMSKCKKQDKGYKNFYSTVYSCSKKEKNCSNFMNCIETSLLGNNRTQN
jgi:protein-disulfide isomerase